MDDRSSCPQIKAALEKTASGFDCVRVVKNRGAPGAAGARNFGVRMARQPWIAFLDSDDEWTPNSAVRRMEVIERFQERVAWFAGDFEFRRHRGEGEDRYLFEHAGSLEIVRKAYEEKQPVLGLRATERLFVDPIPVHTNTVTIRREAFRKGFWFPEGLRNAEDVHLWWRFELALEGFAFIPEKLAVYHERPGSLSRDFRRPAVVGEVECWESFCRDPRFRDHRPVIRKNLSRALVWACYEYRARRQWRKAAKYAWRLVRLEPVGVVSWRMLAAAIVRRP